MVKSPRNRRYLQRGTMLVTAVVLLLVISTLTVTVLSTRVTNIGIEVDAIHHLRAEAAAQGALQLAAHRLLTDSDLLSALAKVIDNEGDTWVTGSNSLFEIEGNLSGVSFTVSVWPRPGEVRLRAQAESDGAYATRWSRLPVQREGS